MIQFIKKGGGSSEYNVKINGDLTYNSNSGIISIIEEVDMNGINLTKMRGIFSKGNNLVEVKNLNTDNVTDMNSAFYDCQNIITIPDINTNKVSDFSTCFWNCLSLVNVPVLSFKSPLGSTTKLSYMFSNCPNLSNESLNNILLSCANSYVYLQGTKTLKQIGLTSAQATICQGLSNYQAFLAAGWTTGY